MGLLPWGLARILGITVYLDIPADTAAWAAVFGAVLAAIGFAARRCGGGARAAASRRS